MTSTNNHRIFDEKERKNNLLRFVKGCFFKSRYSAKKAIDNMGKAKAIEKIVDGRGTALTTFTVKMKRVKVKYARQAAICVDGKVKRYR